MIEKIYAQLSCTRLVTSIPWFEALFGRPPDDRPMDGLAEWHIGKSAGFQLFRNESAAGQGTMTLIVSGLQDERRRLERLGLRPPLIEAADTVSLLQLRDPDNNLVVLARPGAKR